MDFVKLRLAGFKSFVDATELVIEPGMTGIVGPNGCGKSNLVEALRWVMGESSARRMRGDEMDDVIFGGTARRPARNLAEVSLCLDNTSRTAPAGFNDATDLEVVRRIERGAGSDYRINGKPVRARDVQLLFADNASGAGSPGLVSQGKVGALISAKPQDRRQLLEEAAGITGLHGRRHEAELRLRAAETNLTRLDDVIGAMDTQFQGLKKQARQATRYRNLSDLIRRAEAVVWHLRWSSAERDLIDARQGFGTAEVQVRTLMLAVTQLTSRRLAEAEGLPSLRQAEAAAAAALQRLVLAREALDAEERRVVEARESNRRRLAQVEGDLGREQGLAADAGGALARLSAEATRLTNDREDEAALHEAASDAVAETRETVDDLDRALTRLTEQAAADEAQRGALTRRVQETDQRLAGLNRRLDEQRRQSAALEAEIAARPDLIEAEAAVEAAEERLDSLRDQADQAERAKSAAETARNQARESQLQAESARARLKAEQNALVDLLKAGAGDLFPPLIDAVTVAAGYEGAFAAALGDDLTAPLDEAAAVHWRTLTGYDPAIPLPPGAEPLAAKVDGPPALARRLAHLGVVADLETGNRLARSLAPGQTLVTRAGAAWRWDGFTVKADAPTAAAVRLRQRNRLAELGVELGGAEEALADARDRLTAATLATNDATARERQARDAVREAFSRIGQERDRHARLAREAAAAASKLAALIESQDRAEADQREAAAALGEAKAALAALPAAGPVREQLAERRAELAERRTQLAERQSQLDRLTREAAGRRQRLAAIDTEQRSWRSRLDGADGRLGELTERAATARAELERLADRPAEIDRDRQGLLSAISEAERARKRTADALAAAEAQLGGTEKQLKQAESGLADAREARARAEAAVAAAIQAEAVLRERIAERLDCEPAAVLALSGLQPGDELPEASAVESRLERLTRERDNMGPVNLRAELEAGELEQQITVLQTERADLIGAIGRLRQGIASLNREARERLLGSFETVNQHFQTLFTRLFGGGRAHLELTQAEDPLNAGLEIYASPPGKRLQALSLLSGGEQALTALSLLFAVFLTNPSPICVLDEVDAPLDEANVERFCAMVQDMAQAGASRFLVITHHRLTMARADRLFGVTMGEQGISQLVSVDLHGAEAIRAFG
ncbi:MAG: chromosome segregation protein SMC [Azospirillum sp.]|nr:chromosome segregation protein SMC [Azospirillum sp.]